MLVSVSLVVERKKADCPGPVSSYFVTGPGLMLQVRLSSRELFPSPYFPGRA